MYVCLYTCDYLHLSLTTEDTEVLKEDEGVESTSPVDGAKKTIKKQVIAKTHSTFT